MNKKRFGGVKIALLSAIGAAAVGFTGYKIFFNRAGEAAVALIPSDASFVLTLDTNPSTNQLPTFTKISNALKAEGFDKDISSGMESIIGKAGLVGQLQPYVSTNFAIAMWSPQGDHKTHGLALFSLKDKAGAENALKNGKPAAGANIPAYTFENEEMVMGVVGDYLAVASDVDTLNRSEAAHQGGPSIAGLAEYQSARAGLPTDSNLMCFISPNAMKELGKATPNGFIPNKWMAMSATIRETGLEFDYRGPLDGKWAESMNNIAPLSPSTLNRLPAGAFGVIAYSQPSSYYSIFKEAATQADKNGEFDRQLKEFEDKTGISIDNDLVPALKGTAIVAAYPDATANPRSADVTAVLTNDNGANPADLVGKLRATFDREVAKHTAEHPSDPLPHLQERTVAGAQVWSLDEQSLTKMHEGMPKDSLEIFGNKNLLIAVKDGSVYLCSSDAMLTKALSPERQLNDDPAFAEMLSKAGDDPQSYILLAVGRLIESYRAEIDKTSDKTHMTTENWLSLFGGANAGLVISGKINREVGTATFFVPLNWEEAIHAVGRQKRESQHPATPTEQIAIPDSPETSPSISITR